MRFPSWRGPLGLTCAAIVSIGCGGTKASVTGSDASVDAGPDVVDIPLPYGGTWPSNSGCWDVPGPPTSCGCRFDPAHSNDTHDNGVHCDGVTMMCTCYSDGHSTKAIADSPDMCSGGIESPGLKNLWSQFCGFPPVTWPQG
jgi:hypothetical protein